MNKKMNAVLIVVMIYVQFMGPFVLKANFEGQSTTRNLQRIKNEVVIIKNDVEKEVKKDWNSLVDNTSDGLTDYMEDMKGLYVFARDSHNPILMVVALVGAAARTCIFLAARALAIAWFFFWGAIKAVAYAVVKAFEFLVFVCTGKWWRRALQSPRDPNGRFRSLTTTSDKKPRTAEEQKELQDQINMYIGLIGKRIGLEKIENESAESGFFSGKWAKKMWNSVTGDKGGKILPAMTDNEMKMALRDLFDIEMTDLIQMKAELDKIPNTPGTPAIEYHDNCRRKRNHFLELRIGRATDLINTNMYQDNKYKKTLEYKRTIYPVEIAAIEKILSDKKTTDEVRKTESDKLKGLLEKDDPKKDPKTIERESAKKTSYFYDVGGIDQNYLFKKFFLAYNKASYVVILRKEKASIDMETTTHSLAADKKAMNEEAKETLQKSIDKLLTDLEFR